MSQRFTATTRFVPSGFSLTSTGAHSLCGWVYDQSTGSGSVLILAYGSSFSDRCGIFQFGPTPNSAQTQDLQASGGSYAFAYAPTFNGWKHVAITTDGTTVRTYVNGSQVDSQSPISYAGRGAFTNFNIGNNGGSTGCDVTFQDVFVFSQNLTQSQVQECMRLSAPSGVTPYAWFKLLNSAPTADSSGNGRALDGAGDSNGTQILISATGTTSTSGSASAFSNAVPPTSSQRFSSGGSVTASAINFVGSAAHTVCGWVNVATAAGADVCYLDPGGGGDGGNSIWLGFDGTTWQWNDQISGSGYAYSQAITTGSWHHLALTYDGTNCRSYLDGALVNGPSAVSLGARANMNHLDIGFGGDFTVQSVMVLPQALSAAQIAEAMRLAPPAGVIPYAWYPFVAGSPTTDQSGHAHTLSGGGDSNGTNTLIVASGGTSATGSATVARSQVITAAGTTNSTGSAVFATLMTASGATSATGAASLSKSAQLVAAGVVQSTGSAQTAISFPLNAAGTTQTTGLAGFLGFVVSSGSTATTGSASLGAAASITASGATTSSGSAALSGLFPSGGSNPGRQTGSRQRLAMPFTGRRQVRC